MLSRKEIEARVKHYDAEQGAGLSSGGVFDGKVYHEREVWDAALALYDENERLKDNIDGWKAVMKKTIGADAADAIKGLEAENERLKRDNDILSKGSSPDLREILAENARLREELTQRNSSYLRLSKSESALSKHIVALEAVVEAAATLACDMHTICREEEKTPPERFIGYYDACHDICNAICEAKKAALEKVEGK